MKLTVLGCYAPYAPENGACNGYLLQSARINMMIDCGHGTFAQLQRFLNFRQLHCLVVTHFHPDHYADIHAIRHAFAGAIRDGSRQGPLVVYLPREPAKIYEMINSWTESFVVIPIDDAQELLNPLGDFQLGFFPVQHPLTTYGLRVICENKVFTYTSDTSWHQGLINNCRHSDFLLAEASLRDVDFDLTSKGHMTAKQAGLLAYNAGVQKLAITHFWPEFNLYQLKREAEVGFESVVDLAQMGKIFII